MARKPRNKPSKEKICPVCGTVFIADGKKGGQIYCSSECYFFRQNERRRNREYDLVCAVCGKPFKGKLGRNACSVECRTRLSKTTHAERMDIRFNGTKSKKQIRKLRRELMAKVKASGMSYGQYRAMEGRPQKIPEETVGAVPYSNTWMQGTGTVTVTPREKPKIRAVIRADVQKLPKAPMPTKNVQEENERIEFVKYCRWMGIPVPGEEEEQKQEQQ